MSNVKQNVLEDICRPFVPGLVSLLVFSFFSSLLNLVPPVFMMQLSERVMLSRNEMTLLFLTVIALFLIAALTMLDAIRARTLNRIGTALDAKISERVFDSLNRRRLRVSEPIKYQILGDLNAVRDFVGGPVLGQLLDLFWTPLILLVMFLLHPWIGFTMLVILVVTIALSLANQWAVGPHMKRAQSGVATAHEFARAVITNADVIRPMGMLPALRRRWRGFHEDASGWQQAAIGRSELWTGVLRFVRYSQLIVLLVVGAWLYLQQQVTAGAVFGVIYIAMRIIGPVLSVTSSWRTISNMRTSVERLNLVLNQEGDPGDRMSLPRPKGSLNVSRVVLTPPNEETVVLGDVSFSLQNGRILGVVGPSGAGKSSLARLLVGAWHPRRGTVKLDDHDLFHWNEDELGQHIGYVPQEIGLLPGTVAENIARFRDDGPLDHEAVLEAAELAGIEDVIQGLPDGYNTRVGTEGHVFSGGQRQRIALARAVYRSPRLLVLDEPNSNLDAVGEQFLGRTLTLMKSRGSTVVLITHRMSMLMFCDDLLVMNAGTIHTCGPRETILNRLPAYRLGSTPALETAVGQ